MNQPVSLSDVYKKMLVFRFAAENDVPGEKYPEPIGMTDAMPPVKKESAYQPANKTFQTGASPDRTNEIMKNR